MKGPEGSVGQPGNCTGMCDIYCKFVHSQKLKMVLLLIVWLIIIQEFKLHNVNLSNQILFPKALALSMS